MTYYGMAIFKILRLALYKGGINLFSFVTNNEVPLSI